MGQVQAGVKVYVPLGSANEILVIDAERDEVVGRIGDVTNAHGLAAIADGNYLVAGSMSLAPKNQKIPEGMSEDEHNAHHSSAEDQDTKAKYGASFKDPVCGMEVSRMTAIDEFLHLGKAYYFCAGIYWEVLPN
jgi:hypothetical protein